MREGKKHVSEREKGRRATAANAPCVADGNLRCLSGAQPGHGRVAETSPSRGRNDHSLAVRLARETKEEEEKKKEDKSHANKRGNQAENGKKKKKKKKKEKIFELEENIVR